jgi:hypothetical protein
VTSSSRVRIVARHYFRIVAHALIPHYVVYSFTQFQFRVTKGSRRLLPHMAWTVQWLSIAVHMLIKIAGSAQDMLHDGYMCGRFQEYCWGCNVSVTVAAARGGC